MVAVEYFDQDLKNTEDKDKNVSHNKLELYD